jgi:hypothetical protein
MELAWIPGTKDRLQLWITQWLEYQPRDVDPAVRGNIRSLGRTRLQTVAAGEVHVVTIAASTHTHPVFSISYMHTRPGGMRVGMGDDFGRQRLARVRLNSFHFNNFCCSASVWFARVQERMPHPRRGDYSSTPEAIRSNLYS